MSRWEHGRNRPRGATHRGSRRAWSRRPRSNASRSRLRLVEEPADEQPPEAPPEPEPPAAEPATQAAEPVMAFEGGGNAWDPKLHGNRRRPTTAEQAVPWMIGIILALTGMVIVLLALIFSSPDGLVAIAPSSTPLPSASTDASAEPSTAPSDEPASPSAGASASTEPTPGPSPTPAPTWGPLEMVYLGRPTDSSPHLPPAPRLQRGSRSAHPGPGGPGSHEVRVVAGWHRRRRNHLRPSGCPDPWGRSAPAGGGHQRADVRLGRRHRVRRAHRARRRARPRPDPGDRLRQPGRHRDCHDPLSAPSHRVGGAAARGAVHR